MDQMSKRREISYHKYTLSCFNKKELDFPEDFISTNNMEQFEMFKIVICAGIDYFSVQTWPINMPTEVSYPDAF